MATTLSVPARTAFAHTQKADKLVKEAAELRVQAAKADRLEAKAEEHYKAAGLIYARIKAEHDFRRDGPWKKVCKAKCGVSWQRVYQLIDLVAGRVTLADQRQRNATQERNRYREKKSNRFEPVRPFEQQHRPRPKAHEDTMLDSEAQSNQHAYLQRAQVAIDYAGFIETDEVLNYSELAAAARRAAEAWNKLATFLERKARNEKGKGKGNGKDKRVHTPDTALLRDQRR